MVRLLYADVEPKHMPDHQIYRLLDLAATEEDQHEVRLSLSPPSSQYSELTSIGADHEPSEGFHDEARWSEVQFAVDEAVQ